MVNEEIKILVVVNVVFDNVLIIINIVVVVIIMIDFFFGVFVLVNVVVVINVCFGLVDGLFYGIYKIGINVNDFVLNDGGCFCVGVFFFIYFKVFKLNNFFIELLFLDFCFGFVLDGFVGFLCIEGCVIIFIYDINDNKIVDIEY